VVTSSTAVSDTVNRLGYLCIKKKNLHFGNWICFRYKTKVSETVTCAGVSQRQRISITEGVTGAHLIVHPGLLSSPNDGNCLFPETLRVSDK
jgi:hypothetical protein